MADDPLSDIIASVRARLQHELEAQLRVIAERHEQALTTARRDIEAAAAERWGGLLHAARGEAQQKTEAALSALRAELEREHAEALAQLRAEAERQLNAERNRIGAEADQRMAEAVSRTRRELEQALATERQLAQSRLEAERRLAAEQLELARHAFDAELAAANVLPAASAGALIDALMQVDRSASVSDTLAALSRAAASRGRRAAVFVANGAQLDEWVVSGVEPLGSAAMREGRAELLDRALKSATTARGADAAFAVPLLLDGVAVGVLYGEPRRDGEATDFAAVLEALARHAAAHLAYLTAVRTAQARQWLAAGGHPGGTAGSPGGASEDEVAAARRYARLLVSEIKLYNDTAVRTGRERRDLLQRLRPEIDRARRLYEERVPVHVTGRAEYFHNELVQTLAGGDASLLN
ncbi:MAG TPA: hypothetical protein VM364_11265 [Vicinamibacterales bacterium]|nr:hypothetical protein [Vicinamibacterales bacterium]